MDRRRLAPAWLMAALLAGALPADAAINTDPDWPCIQRKVPQLSLGQIWTGKALPDSAARWQDDKDVADMVAEIAPRRVTLDEARSQIRDFAARLPAETRSNKLLGLVQGLFEHMDHERSQVISGIGRYARGQIALAKALRKEAETVDDLRDKPDANQTEVTARSDRLAFQTRIFEERAQALTYVCEVPTLIEQRLYQLAKAVSDVLPKE